MMTSFAFILGVVPLLFAHGAGAEMRQTLGTAVFSGMLGVTFFGIFLTPVFFYVIDCLGETHAVPLSRWSGASSGFAIGMLSLRPVRELVRRMAAGRPARRQAVPGPDPEARTAARAGTGRRARRAYVRGASMFSKFFIDRPIFASVLSIVIILAGGIAAVHAADRAVPRDHAADGRGVGRTTPGPTPRSSPTPSPRPIEQQVNGVENMLYMSSQCTNDGTLHADRDVRARHRPEHGPGAGAEPRRPGRADPARPGQAPRRRRSRRSRPAC